MRAMSWYGGDALWGGCACSRCDSPQGAQDHIDKGACGNGDNSGRVGNDDSEEMSGRNHGSVWAMRCRSDEAGARREGSLLEGK